MDANMWFIISIIGYSLSGLLFIVAVFMFIKMNIPAIIGDLTGRTAAKQIKEIRERNISSGEKRFKPNAFNIERGKLTELITGRSKQTGNTGQMARDSKRLDLKGKTEETSRPIVLEDLQKQGYQTNVREEPGVTSERTYVLSDGTQVLTEETDVLSDGTEVLMEENMSTEVLTDGTEVLQEGTAVLVESDLTTVLGNTDDLTNDQFPLVQGFEFKIVKDIKVVHTNEVI